MNEPVFFHVPTRLDSGTTLLNAAAIVSVHDAPPLPPTAVEGATTDIPILHVKLITGEQITVIGWDQEMFHSQLRLVLYGTIPAGAIHDHVVEEA